MSGSSIALERYLDELVPRFAACNDAEGLALVGRCLAELRRREGRALDALRLCRDAWGLVLASGPAGPRVDEDAAACLLGMARALLALGEPEAAEQCAAEAAEGFASVGSRIGHGLALMVQAGAAAGADRAASLLKAAADALVAGGHARAAAVALRQLAEHHRHRGETAAADLCEGQAERYAVLR